jgi:hypothetical protein
VSRSKRRKSSWLPLALPINLTRKPRVGDSVVVRSPLGDPRITSTSLKAAFAVSPQIPIGPLLLSDFVTVEPLTDKQCNALQETLGVPLTKAAREEIDAAIQRMVATIALAARIPGWGDFRERLAAIIKSGRAYIKAAHEFVQMSHPRTLSKDKPKGALSVDQAVKTYLSLAGFKDSIVPVEIDAILESCRQGLEEVEPRASKRPEVNIGLANFLRAIDTIAQESGAPTTLPSDSVRERSEPLRLTRHFRFGRECLKIAVTNGEASITTASLTDQERSYAEKIFSQLHKYFYDNRQSIGAFLSRWRKARADLKTVGTAN